MNFVQIIRKSKRIDRQTLPLAAALKTSRIEPVFLMPARGVKLASRFGDASTRCAAALLELLELLVEVPPRGLGNGAAFAAVAAAAGSGSSSSCRSSEAFSAAGSSSSATTLRCVMFLGTGCNLKEPTTLCQTKQTKQKIGGKVVVNKAKE